MVNLKVTGFVFRETYAALAAALIDKRPLEFLGEDLAAGENPCTNL
jgi:hypothetical protein